MPKTVLTLTLTQPHLIFCVTLSVVQNKMPWSQKRSSRCPRTMIRRCLPRYPRYLEERKRKVRQGISWRVVQQSHNIPHFAPLFAPFHTRFLTSYRHFSALVVLVLSSCHLFCRLVVLSHLVLSLPLFCTGGGSKVAAGGGPGGGGSVGSLSVSEHL